MSVAKQEPIHYRFLRQLVKYTAIVVLISVLACPLSFFTSLSIPFSPSPGSSVLGLLSVFVPLRRAKEEVEKERKRAEAEVQGFDQFLAAVQELNPDIATQSSSAPPGTVLVTEGGLPQKSEKVKQAYRETVMDVPHYDAEYGESIDKNMEMEMGEEVTSSLRTCEQFTPQLKEGILFKTHRAREERMKLLRTVQSERHDLRRAQTSLEDIEDRRRVLGEHPSARAFNACLLAYSELEDLAAECEQLLQNRQKQIHKTDSSSTGFDSLHELCTYLYEPLGAEYPVLKTGATVLGRVRNARQNVFDYLCSFG